MIFDLYLKSQKVSLLIKLLKICTEQVFEVKERQKGKTTCLVQIVHPNEIIGLVLPIFQMWQILQEIQINGESCIRYETYWSNKIVCTASKHAGSVHY